MVLENIRELSYNVFLYKKSLQGEARFTFGKAQGNRKLPYKQVRSNWLKFIKILLAKYGLTC